MSDWLHDQDLQLLTYTTEREVMRGRRQRNNQTGSVPVMIHMELAVLEMVLRALKELHFLRLQIASTTRAYEAAGLIGPFTHDQSAPPDPP